MVKLHVSGTGFVEENVLCWIDEGHSLRDPATGVTRNVGALAEELADALNRLGAEGVTLAGMEKVCLAICAFVSVVEEAAYVEGAVAQRDGREIVSSRPAEEKRWYSAAIDDGDFEKEDV